MKKKKEPNNVSPPSLLLFATIHVSALKGFFWPGTPGAATAAAVIFFLHYCIVYCFPIARPRAKLATDGRCEVPVRAQG